MLPMLPVYLTPMLPVRSVTDVSGCTPECALSSNYQLGNARGTFVSSSVFADVDGPFVAHPGRGLLA